MQLRLVINKITGRGKVRGNSFVGCSQADAPTLLGGRLGATLTVGVGLAGPFVLGRRLATDRS